MEKPRARKSELRAFFPLKFGMKGPFKATTGLDDLGVLLVHCSASLDPANFTFGHPPNSNPFDLSHDSIL